MSLKQTVYFMALVGAIAGLACWVTTAWLSDYLPYGSQDTNWRQVAIAATLMGAYIGAMTVGFADHWTSDRVVPSWVLIGAMLGGLAGFLSGLVYWPIEARLVRSANPLAGTLGRGLIWLVIGGLIGLVIGLRWLGANRL